MDRRMARADISELFKVNRTLDHAFAVFGFADR
jgi:hypothetical protein